MTVPCNIHTIIITGSHCNVQHEKVGLQTGLFRATWAQKSHIKKGNLPSLWVSKPLTISSEQISVTLPFCSGTTWKSSRQTLSTSPSPVSPVGHLKDIIIHLPEFTCTKLPGKQKKSRVLGACELWGLHQLVHRIFPEKQEQEMATPSPCHFKTFSVLLVVRRSEI